MREDAINRKVDSITQGCARRRPLEIPAHGGLTLNA